MYESKLKRNVAAQPLRFCVGCIHTCGALCRSSCETTCDTDCTNTCRAGCETDCDLGGGFLPRVTGILG